MFAALLRKDGVTVKGAVRPGDGARDGARAREVSRRRRWPRWSHRMLTDSDNDLAEALGRAVALHDGRAGDLRAARLRRSSPRSATLGVARRRACHCRTPAACRTTTGSRRGALVAVLRAAAVDRHPQLRAAARRACRSPGSPARSPIAIATAHDGAGAGVRPRQDRHADRRQCARRHGGRPRRPAAGLRVPGLGRRVARP